MRACCEGCALSRTWCRGHAVFGCDWVVSARFVVWDVRVTSTSVGWRFPGFMDLTIPVCSASQRTPRGKKRALKSSRDRITSGPIGFVSVLIRFLSDYFR